MYICFPDFGVKIVKQKSFLNAVVSSFDEIFEKYYFSLH